MPGRLYHATWGRLFVAGYDCFLASAERAGLHELRRELLASARGRCLEVGAGTGLNTELWPRAGIEELVLSEPNEFMAAKLRDRVAELRPEARIVEAPAERLPFGDASFDTVALTLVLCTTPEPAVSLREIHRVLRPGGLLLFLEHVRSAGARLARVQDRVNPAWRLFGDGCNCNRDTLRTLRESPFELERTEHGAIPGAFPLVRPMLRGAARVPIAR